MPLAYCRTAPAAPLGTFCGWLLLAFSPCPSRLDELGGAVVLKRSHTAFPHSVFRRPLALRSVATDHRSEPQGH